MAIVKGTNSYVTLNEANAYFANRIDAASWEEASADKQEKALITATMTLDTIEWAGSAISDTQSLAFPRNGIYFDPRLGYNVSLDSAVATARIENATFELALHLLNNEGVLDDTGSIRSLGVSSINLGTIIPAGLTPQTARRLYKPLQVHGGSRAWWRAN